MFNLANVIALKIIVTMGFWSFPLLVAPGFFLPQAGLELPENTILLSLLGWAYVALCVGYGYGFLQARKGIREKGILAMGVVSNGGACLIMLFNTMIGMAPELTLFGNIIALGSVAFTGFFAVSLYLLGLREA